MPASLPGSTAVQNAANPNAGAPVIFDLLSGPKGSPRDNDKDYPYGGSWQIPPPAPAPAPAANGNASTGGMSTGIGFGMNLGPQGIPSITPNFNDNYVPGVTKPDNTASADSTVMYIGGGKSEAPGRYSAGGQAPATDPAGLSRTVPFTAGFGIGAAGGGGSRDAGAGPAFTGFTMKMVTVPAGPDIANGSVIETGFTNRSGVTLAPGANQFGSTGTATAAPSMTKAEEEEAQRNAVVAKKAEEDRQVKAKAPEAKPAPKEEPKEKEVEKVKLAQEMDEAAKKEEERIKKEERERGSKLPPVTGTFHAKEDGDDLKTGKVTPKKDK